VLAPVAGELGLAGAAEQPAGKAQLAARRHVQPAEDVEQRALAAAGGPEQHDELAALDVERDAGQGHHVHLAGAIHLRELPGREDRLAARIRHAPIVRAPSVPRLIAVKRRDAAYRAGALCCRP